MIIVNIDNLPATSFASAFESAGLNSKAYSPDSASMSVSDWPTLGTLVDAGTTLVVFMDNSADHSSTPYILDEFSNMWEDAYDVTDTTWGCAVNRSTGESSSTLFMINHFLDNTYTLAGTTLFVPNKDELNTTNSQDSISTHVGNCNSIYGRNPNHILLDFYDTNSNEPFNYVASLNGVSAPTNSVTALAATSTASGSSASENTGAATTAKVTSSPNAGTRRDWNLVAVGSGVVAVTIGVMFGGAHIWL